MKDKFKLLEKVDEDNYVCVYAAYDKVKKQHCYVTIPKKETSWNYSVIY